MFSAYGGGVPFGEEEPAPVAPPSLLASWSSHAAASEPAARLQAESVAVTVAAAPAGVFIYFII